MQLAELYYYSIIMNLFDGAEKIVFNCGMSIQRTEMGKRIRGIRKKAEMNQEQFGATLGVVKSSISGYESGDGTPSIEALIKIAEIGQVTLDWLLTGSERDYQLLPTPKTVYPLSEDDKNALTAAESLLKWRGLNDRFAVAEVVAPVDAKAQLSDEEHRLVNAFRLLDRKIQESILIQVEMTAEGLRKSGKKEPQGGGLTEAV